MIGPLDLTSVIGKTGLYIVEFIIGLGFGGILEQAGFGNSRLLARQFYFRDMTVLKVMFTAIITAMLLIFLFAGWGILDYTKIWVNPTYLLPGIIGGFIMGIGFVIGGYCPGTSLVSMATFKLDGLFFVIGVLLGIFAFGESIDSMAIFWNSNYLGRFTLPNWLNTQTPWVVLMAVILALVMFKGGEWAENKVSGPGKAKLPLWASISFLCFAGIILFIGFPTGDDRWPLVAKQEQSRIDSREIFIEPKEFAYSWLDDKLKLHVWDLRSEPQFTRFHIKGAQRKTIDEFDEEKILKLKNEPMNHVFILVSDDEAHATRLWKRLTAYRLHNVYILDGGVQKYLSEFKEHHDFKIEKNQWQFPEAMGSKYEVSQPDPHWVKKGDFLPKLKLQIKQAVAAGGCG